MKHAREHAAFDKVAAWVVISPDGEKITQVHAHYGESVVVTVYDYDFGEPQTARAGGGGYDRFTAALSGMSIQGHHMSDHCGERLETPDCGYWEHGFEPPAGYRMANYDSEKGGWVSCHRISGLDYLTALGYTVIQAV